MRPLAHSLPPTTQNNVSSTAPRCSSIRVARHSESISVVPNVLVVTKPRRGAHGEGLVGNEPPRSTRSEQSPFRPGRIRQDDRVGSVPAVFNPLHANRPMRCSAQCDLHDPTLSELKAIASTSRAAMSVSPTNASPRPKTGGEAHIGSQMFGWSVWLIPNLRGVTCTGVPELAVF